MPKATIEQRADLLKIEQRPAPKHFTSCHPSLLIYIPPSIHYRYVNFHGKILSLLQQWMGISVIGFFIFFYNFILSNLSILQNENWLWFFYFTKKIICLVLESLMNERMLSIMYDIDLTIIHYTLNLQKNCEISMYFLSNVSGKSIF